MAPKDDLRIKCMECGHKNPAGVDFCTKCRAKMTLKCADCGFKSPQRSEFCGSCGKETEFGRENARKREVNALRDKIEESERRERAEAKAAAKQRQRAKEAKLAAPHREVRKTLRRTRIVVVGIWLTVYLLPLPLTLLFILAYIGFTGRFLRDRHPHLRWQKSLTAPAGFAVTNLVIIVLVMVFLIFPVFFPDASDPAIALAQFLGPWEGGPEDGGWNYPFFRDFIIPWEWPFSPIRRLN